MSSTRPRRLPLLALALLTIACARLTVTSPTTTPLERTALQLGLPASGYNFLPVYLAAERTAAEEGLHLEIVDLQGDALAGKALVSGSVDVAVLSPSPLVNLIDSGQRVKGFYAAALATDPEWYAAPSIRSWGDLRGKAVGILALGGLSDALTREVLRRHGLRVGQDVQVQPVGGSANALAAIQVNTIQAAFLVPPFTWQAEQTGLNRLGSRSREVTAQWPRSMLTANEHLFEEAPNTIRSLLRAHVRAVRLARSDRELVLQTLMTRLRFTRPQAERAYAELVPLVDERGGQTTGDAAAFWDVTIAAGEVREAWPESRYFDSRFVDSFEAWVPR